MIYTTKNTTIPDGVVVGDLDVRILEENPDRRMVTFSVDGASVFIKLMEVGENDPLGVRKGIVVHPNVPFSLMPDIIYWGDVYAINMVQGTTATVYVTELNKD